MLCQCFVFAGITAGQWRLWCSGFQIGLDTRVIIWRLKQNYGDPNLTLGQDSGKKNIINHLSLMEKCFNQLKSKTFASYRNIIECSTNAVKVQGILI